VVPEDKDMGDITFKDYQEFVSYSYGCCGLFGGFLICTLTAIAQLLPSLWMTEWLGKGLDEQ